MSCGGPLYRRPCCLREDRQRNGIRFCSKWGLWLDNVVDILQALVGWYVSLTKWYNDRFLSNCSISSVFPFLLIIAKCQIDERFRPAGQT